MKKKRQRWNVCEEFSVWHFVTKSTGLKSVKPSISGHFPESIDPAAVLIRPCVQNVPGKNGELSPSGYSLLYTHGKAGQSLSKGQVAWLHLRTCLVPSWCGASRTIWGILGPPRAASPVSLPKGKSGHKKSENEWVWRPTLNLCIYEIVFCLFAKTECRIQTIEHIWTETGAFVKMR